MTYMTLMRLLVCVLFRFKALFFQLIFRKQLAYENLGPLKLNI